MQIFYGIIVAVGGLCALAYFGFILLCAWIARGEAP